MSGIGLDKLREYAQTGDVELRLVQPKDSETPQIETREGTWHGRMMRNLKVDWESDRSGKQVEYHGAHNEVWKALCEAYGQEIGEKAFRAGGFGGQDGHGNWRTDSNHPITGRHIEKMLAFGDKEHAREVARNRAIAEWMGVLRNDGSGTSEVMLGEKVSQPRGTIRKEEAFRGLGDDLEKSTDDWHRESQDKHGFWILDVTVEGSPRRIGIHVDRSNPERMQLLGLDGDYNVNIPKGKFSDWLSQHLHGRDVTSMALYRQDNPTLQLSERVKDAQPTLARLDNLEKRGVRGWIPKALQAIEDSVQLLRSNFTMGSVRDLKLQVDQQLGQINRYLMDGDVVTPMQMHLQERYALNNGIGGKIHAFLEPLGMDNVSGEKVYRALVKEAETFMGELYIRRGSLSDEQTRSELGERLGSRLGQLLEDMDWDLVDRVEARERGEEIFGGLMTELNERVFTPQHELLQNSVEPLRQDVTRELEKQRVLLEERSKSLEVRTRVESEPVEIQGIVKPEGSRGSGLSVRLTDKVEVAPLQLSFSKQGESIVATVPHLFPKHDMKYSQTGENRLSWNGVVLDHQDRLNLDKSGVPGRGKENDISLPIHERTSSGGIDLKIGDEEIPSLTELELEMGWGDQSLLTREQYCGLTRFLNDKAFQDVYAQAVRRLYPSGEDGPGDTECRQVGIIIDTHVGEDGQQVFDITFRGVLPDGDLRYHALPQDGLLPEDAPTHDVEGDDLLLSLTMHVPFDQLQSGRPKVTIDEPGIIFLQVPENYETDLHLPPQGE